MRITGVRVEVSKTVSDGRYGNERYNAQYIAELDEGEDPDEAIRILSERGRANVIGQLAESESASIRYAIAPPKDISADEMRCDGCGRTADELIEGVGDDAGRMLCPSCDVKSDIEATDDIPF